MRMSQAPTPPGRRMPLLVVAAALVWCLFVATPRASADPPAPGAERETIMIDLLSIPVEKADGTTETLARYRGKALLIVNTASECGFTPQYADLEKLYQLYKDRGLVVLAFPSNDFGAQEPGTNAEIQEFCSSRYRVTFPVMGKVSVVSPGWCPLFRALVDGEGDERKGAVGWNFEKFLIDSQGRYVRRFVSRVNPLAPEVVNAVEDALPKAPGGG